VSAGEEEFVEKLTVYISNLLYNATTLEEKSAFRISSVRGG
jgi:hypothetical protein